MSPGATTRRPLALLLTLLSPFASQADAIGARVQQWGVWELELRGPAQQQDSVAAAAAAAAAAAVAPTAADTGRPPAAFVANPFVDVSLEVSFALTKTNGRGGGGSEITVRGFYDGAGIYRVRFSPPEPGPWRYSTWSNQPVLSGKIGSFVVEPADPQSGNHGPVVSRGYELVHMDGTLHHSTGTTCYQWASMPKARQERTLQTLMANSNGSVQSPPFNKIRMTVFPKWYQYNRQNPVEVGAAFPIKPGSAAANRSAWNCVGSTCPSLNGSFDLTRFNVSFWQNYESLIQRLDAANIIADIIVFHPYDNGHWGFDCLGGTDPKTYDTKYDDFYLQYLAARLSAYKNVWWSMANEWSLCACKSYGATPYANSSTPTWDHLFRVLSANDPYKRQMSIHNGPLLYNHSRAWISHVSLQGHIGDTAGLRLLYGKPIIWDEVKYEGNITSEWGALSGVEEADRFWWAAAKGVYAGHSETVLDWRLPAGDNMQPLWWAKGGELRGLSPARIAWFRAQQEQRSLSSDSESSSDSTAVKYTGHRRLRLSRPPLVGPSGHPAVFANGLGVWAESITATNGSQMLLRFTRPGTWHVPLPTPPRPTPPGVCVPLMGINCNGGDIRNGGVASSATTCCAMCAGEASCVAWTWNFGYNGDCWLKTSCPQSHRSHDPNVVSGVGLSSGQPVPPVPADLSIVRTREYAYDVYALDFWEMKVRLLHTVGPGTNVTTVVAESVPLNVHIVRRELSEQPQPHEKEKEEEEEEEEEEVMQLEANITRNNDCIITDPPYSAKADNKTINTAAIQRAIDDCHIKHPAGARVVVPAGAFKTGALELRSNIELHLEKGAGLYGSTNPADYPIVRGLPFGMMWKALVSGYNLTNVKVTGENAHVPGNDSIVDGVGWWWNCLKYESHGSLVTNIPNPAAAPYCQIFNPHNMTVAEAAGVTGKAPLRPKLIEFFNCTGVTIANFTAQNAACWTIHPTFSRDVAVQRMTVRGPREIGGVDGVDPDSCVDCIVEDSHIDAGDDGISIKSYNYSYVLEPTPCHNVTVRRTTVLSRNVCLGASTSGGVSDVTFEDMILGEQGSMPSLPWAIKFKISSGLIRNVTFRRIKIGRVGDTPWMYPNDKGSAFMIDFFDKNKTAPQTWVRELSFKDIYVVAAKSVGHFSGPGSCIEGLTIRNVTVGEGTSIPAVRPRLGASIRQKQEAQQVQARPSWGGCTGVDMASSSVQTVSPPLLCKGC